MTSISQAIWKKVQQNCMALSHVAKHHTLQVNSKMIRHLTLSALVLASIPSSAVFVCANETVVNNKISEITVLNSKALENPEAKTDSDIDFNNMVNVTSAVNIQAVTGSSTENTDIHYISVKGKNKSSGSNYDNDGAKAVGDIVIGDSSTAESPNNIVLGNRSHAAPKTNNAILIGNDNSLAFYEKEQNDSAIIGNNITAKGHHNAVLATDYRYGIITNVHGGQLDTHVAGDYNTVIGSGNLVGYDATWDYSNKKWIYTERSSSRDGNVVIGQTDIAHGNNNIIVGNNSYAQNISFAFGTDNKVNRDNSGYNELALGGHLRSSGNQSIAIGAYGTAKGAYAIAIGNGGSLIQEEDEYGDKKIKDGVFANGNCTIALGYNANAKGNFNISVGGLSSATGIQSIALGAAATASVDNGIAIGSLSVADRKSGVAGWDPITDNASTDTSAIWTSTRGAFSVGNFANGKTRQITNVAAGSEDTDAVNLAQLRRAITDSEKDREDIRKDISKVEEDNTDTTYTMKGTKNGDNTTTIRLKDSNDKLGDSITVATKDTTYTMNSTVNGDNTTTLYLTDSDKSDGTGFTVATRDTNTTYQLSEKDNTDGTMTIHLTGSDNKDTAVKVSTKNTTLNEQGNGLKLNGNTLSLDFSDTDGNHVTGSVDLSNFASAPDTNTTYKLDATTDEEKNTTTIHLTDNAGNPGSDITVATRDTNTTYTMTSDKKDDITTIHFNGNDGTSNDIQLKDTTLKDNSDALSLADKKLSLNFEDTSGHKVSGSVKLTDIASAVDTNTTYTLKGEEIGDNQTIIHLKGSDETDNTVTVATRDTRNTVKAGENVTLDTKDNKDGSHEYTINVKANGEVKENNTGLVSGDTVYKETRVSGDGNYVKKENTAGENLTALDAQVKRNADSIISLGDTVYDLSNRVGEMDDRINKVGAGAAALAALHPLDYDPEDKWDIAAGFGNYKNASAGALGLFYRPNERTQFNVGWTMGDDRNMFNAGFSVKLGQGSSYAGYSKADMVQLIEKQKGQITALEATIGEQEKEIQQIEEQMHALMERLEKNRYMAENGDL